MNTINPFVLVGYKSPEYFCDRKKESTSIISAIDNQRNMTLVSLRRMGKTGLIHHVFHQLKKRPDLQLIYLDIFPTTCLNDFIKALSKSILEVQKPKSTITDKLLKLLSHLRPKIAFDTITGQPTLELDVRDTREAENTLEGLFNYLNSENKKTVLAIDEFQQIVQYPEKNMESMLRSLIQKYHHIQCLFSGSQKNMLLSMFQDQNRPFYQSTQMMGLDKIESDLYKSFIVKKFEADNQNINKDLLDKILDWTRGHTYYVQYFCNRLYSLHKQKITMAHIHEIASQIIDENVMVYNNYLKLLTRQQTNLLKAIAKEQIVTQPTAKDFLFTHQLGAASTVKTTLDALVKKDFVTSDQTGYFIVDVFFSRWLQNL